MNRHTLKLATYRLVIVTINGRSLLCHAPVGPDGKARVPFNWALRQLGLDKLGPYRTLVIGA